MKVVRYILVESDGDYAARALVFAVVWLLIAFLMLLSSIPHEGTHHTFVDNHSKVQYIRIGAGEQTETHS
jgi:fatty acid desaturase